MSSRWPMAKARKLTSRSGGLVTVSLITISIRKRFFKQKFLDLVRTDPVARKRVADVEKGQQLREGTTWHKVLHPTRLLGHAHVQERDDVRPKQKSKKLNIGMIRKVDDEERVQQVMDSLKDGQSPELPTAEDQPDLRLDTNPTRPDRIMFEDEWVCRSIVVKN